jgi:hypothetical protein
VQALVRIARLLDELGIDHMLAGSWAAAAHGFARSTHDVDLVIDPDEPSFGTLLERLRSDGWYVPGEAARRAFAARDQFNVIWLDAGEKVDLIIRHDRPFSIEELGRRLPAEVAGVTVHLATVEDTILAKLEWSKETGSARQREDVARLVELRRDDLDVAYLRRWASELGVRAELDDLLAQA